MRAWNSLHNKIFQIMTNRFRECSHSIGSAFVGDDVGLPTALDVPSWNDGGDQIVSREL